MRQRQKRAAARHGEGAREIVNELSKLGARSGHNTGRIWDDWIASMACAISNSVDRRPAVWEAREAEYMTIVDRHGAEVMGTFAQMLAGLIAEIEQADGEFTDLLGSIYMSLELGNDARGQFFTPPGVCQIIAGITTTRDDLRERVAQSGFITVGEPAIGGGATVIPVVTEVLRAGLNPAEHLHITGIDIDRGVLRMAYVQLSLMGVPAVLYVGDTLRMEMREDYYTPIHIVNGWGSRLRAREGLSDCENIA